MISITRLWCGVGLEGDALRYGERKSPGGREHKSLPVSATAAGRRPVVVWNCTRRCNLHCKHCYSASEDRVYDGEMSTGQGRMLIDQLVGYKVPVLLFSGGEPLLRRDLFRLAGYARERGLRLVLSTNGTVIDQRMAGRLKEAGFSYIGISLDGIGAVNDRFRGVKGAFDKALHGFRACVAAGLKVGLRFVLTRSNVEQLPRIFDFIESEGVSRACFYHLVPSGRGSAIKDELLPHDVARRAVETIMDRTEDLHKRGMTRDVLTVDNHCDGVAVYLRLLEKNDERANAVRSLLEWNGGGAASSGVGIACVDWHGNVFPDQFWRHQVLGNIRDRAFGEIWEDLSNPLMKGLKDRLDLLEGKCGRCVYKKACGGSLRVRADLVYGSPWAEDPSCYLSEEEISSDKGR